ncbi:gamma-glutamyltransferase [Salipaludibacillus aurantiacus]|nr:gamma-glutamyltransferase [Salipaludibacillus aurantiacus]
MTRPFKLLLLTFILAAAAAFLLFITNPFDETDSPSLPQTAERAGLKTFFEKDEDAINEFGVSTDNPQATDIGMKVLEEGGNAVDAAVAVAYALGTLEPYSSGIGGGGIMMVHPPGEEPIVYDYRTMAPVSGPVPDSGTGVPGFVAGMDRVHSDLGSVPLEQLVEPSVDLAENGIEIDDLFESRLINSSHRMPVDELSTFYPNGTPLRKGDTLPQPELAETLRSIQAEGPAAFYEGKIGEAMTDDIAGLEKEDLKAYDVQIKESLKGSFYGYEVYSPPAPSAGGMLIQSLQLAEALEVDESVNDPEELAVLLGEINRRAHMEHQEFIGDPDFSDVPDGEMVSGSHTEKLAETIDGKNLKDEFKSPLETKADKENDENTTHFVIVDESGLMVSATNTLSNFFGTGDYIEGFFMTSQLRNFSNNSSSPNYEEAGKRSNSYMVPSILAYESNPVLGIGSAGGRRIPSMLTQTLIHSIVYGLPLQEAVEEPRFYLEVFEDELNSETEISLSGNNGIEVSTSGSPFRFGSVNSLMINYENGTLQGAADPRREGAWRTGRRD